MIEVNPEELARFYCDGFEMEIIDRSATGGVFLSDGYFNIALLPNRAEGKANGLNHFGFQVEDADAIAERLKKWTVRGPAKRPADRHYAEARATDPEGNMFDLSEHGFQRTEFAAEREARKKEKT